MDKIFYFTIFLSPFLLLITYILVAKHQSFKKILLAHTIAFVLYMLIIANYSKLLTGHDAYGLRQLGLGMTLIVIHVVVGIIHGLFLHDKTKKSI